MLPLMRKVSLILIFSFLIVHAKSQTSSPPTNGDGSMGNPYEIATLDNLYWLSQTSSKWNKHFIQTADIDATATSSWDSNAGFSPIGNTTTNFTGTYNGRGYNITNITINRPDTDFIGLFGRLNNKGEISNLGLTNINYTGRKYVGGIVGINSNGTIQKCYSTGTISSNTSDNWWAKIGGIAGSNSGTISFCYGATDITSKSSMLGNLAGDNLGAISNCYSGGNVTGTDRGRVGGFVGENGGSITNSYSYTKVVCSDMATGGFSGYGSGSETNCFWDTQVSGQSSSYGGTGKTTAELQSTTTYTEAGWDFLNVEDDKTNDYWDLISTENSGYPVMVWQGLSTVCKPIGTASNIKITNTQETSFKLESFLVPEDGTAGGYTIYINNKDTWTAPVNDQEHSVNTSWANAGQQCLYTGISNSPDISITGLSSHTKYYIRIYSYNICDGIKTYGNSYGHINQITFNSSAIPTGMGTAEIPYEIATSDNLAWLMSCDSVWNKHFIQTADIDATVSNTWADGAGANPIGSSSKPFSGSYNGKGHSISGFYINKPTLSILGLFGEVGPGAKIDSVGLVDIYIKGSRYIGGLAAHNDGTITNCYSKGTIISIVQNEYVYTGGLVGANTNIISHSFSTASVTNTKGYSVGGLLGINYKANAKISFCYSTGSVKGYNHVGGLVGYNYEKASISNSYSKGYTSGYKYVGGLVGTCNINSYVSSCYSSGRVSASSTRGGLVGYSDDKPKITNSFWDKETSYLSTSAGGTGLTTMEMINPSKYVKAGWDFDGETTNGTDNYWAHNSNSNYGYPFLIYQLYPLSCAPLDQASNIILSDVQNSSFILESFTAASYDGPDGYVIYISDTDDITAPTVGTEPVVNTVWEDAGQQCVYSGSAITPSITITGITQCNAYYIKVFAYNDCSGTKTYEIFGAANIVEPRDNEAPIPDITSMETITDACSVTLTEPTATDNCVGTVTATTTDPMSYTAKGNYTVIWTFDDGNGNSVTQNQTVIILDETAPVPDIANLETISDECSITLTSPTATDNCKGTVTGTTTDPLSYTEQGTYTITWSYNDGSENISSQTQTVIIKDNTAPFPDIATLADINGECSVTISSNPTATDNCKGKITATTTDPLEYTEQGTYTINWTYDDGNGNTTTQQQTVIIKDQTAPIANLSILTDVTGECSATATEVPTATDNCTGTITATTTDPLEYSEQGTHTIIWKFDDGNGNISTQEQKVIIDDQTAPVADAANLADLSDECSVTVTEIPTATDNCEGTITASTTNPLEYTEQGTYIITWKYDDGNGNISIQEQNIIIEDETNPEISCVENQNINIPESKSSYIVTGNELDPASVSDNCEVASIENDFNNSETLDEAEFPVGTTTVTWTVTDAAGNIAECSFNITVSQSTGLTNLKEAGISIWPNPVNDILIINCNKESIDRIRIFDLTGKVIIDQTDISHTEKINLTAFKTGIYIIKINKGIDVYTNRIIKN